MYWLLIAIGGKRTVMSEIFRLGPPPRDVLEEASWTPRARLYSREVPTMQISP